MNTNKWITVTSILFTLLVTGCKESEVDSWTSQLEGMKKEVLTQMDKVPYKLDQNTVFKAYFSKTWDLNWELSQDPRKVKKLNEVLAKKDFSQLCEKILVTQVDWEQVVKNCTINRYFLCVDQVKQYEQALEVLKRYLNAQNLQRFEQTASCKRAP